MQENVARAGRVLDAEDFEIDVLGQLRRRGGGRTGESFRTVNDIIPAQFARNATAAQHERKGRTAVAKAG